MKLIQSLSELTAEAVGEFRRALTVPVPLDKMDPLQKAITQSTGLVYYDLQVPAKQLFPVLTPIRNKIPRRMGRGGTATNWKAVTALNSANLRGAVPEGKRNGTVTTTVESKSASYKTIGLEDTVSVQAELAATNFEDIRATTAQRLLWATMIEEELFDVGGNYSVTLGTPTAPTVTVVDGGGTIADAGGGYDVRVVALTLHGYLASSVAAGVVGLVSVTNPVGTTFTYGGGSSQKSNATATGAVANGNDSAIRASTPVVAGAVAYAWYVGPTGGDVVLQAITTLNSVSLTALSVGTQNCTAITADNGKNLYGYDGILYQAWTTASGAYIANQATGTPGTGTPLTSDTAGGIVEIDAMLESLWANYKLSPSVIYANAQEVKNITKKILASTGADYTIQMTTPSDDLRRVTGGVLVANYLNKFAMGGGQLISIQLHPNMPAGTLMAVTEQLPYPVPNVENVIEMHLRRDYYQTEWAMREMQYESGVYFDGVLAHYMPASIGIITNIGNG